MIPTHEQQAILDAVSVGGTVAISAAAGSGKTSTLRMIAEANPRKHILYLAYNRTVKDDATASFPRNVTCKTSHGLAYNDFGKPMEDRLFGNAPRARARDKARTLEIYDSCAKIDPVGIALLALEAVSRFCHSQDAEITAKHYRPPDGLDPERRTELGEVVAKYAQKAWIDLTTPGGVLKPDPDVYLKMFALSHPTLGYDLILYDEVQDADMCVAGIIAGQTSSQLVAVGDSAQAIYQWRGSADLFKRLPNATRLSLTQSWRFGQRIADLANVWLDVIGADLRVIGNPDRPSTIESLDEPDAILCRTNAGTISELIVANQQGLAAALLGNGSETLRFARAAQRLMKRQPADHRDLIGFASWEGVVQYVKTDPGGSDLAVNVRLIERFGAASVIKAIERASTEKSADVIISTAHKAKGREWGEVRIASDFVQPLYKDEVQPVPVADAMLAYVSVTRAQYTLDPGGLGWIEDHLKELALSA